MFKKLATLVCATAIATSAFTGMVANAALVKDQGINIVAEKVDGADDQITLSVYAVGFTDVRNWGLNLAVTGGTLEAIDPEDFEPDDAANVSSLMWNVDTENNVFVSTGSSTKSVTLVDNLIFTVTLSFTEDISSDITITLDDGSTLKMGNKTTLKYYSSKPDSENTLGFNDAVVKAAPTITPAAVTAVAKQNTDAITGTGEFETQTADIYGVQITANDEAVSGAKIYFDDAHQNTITFNTVCSGGTIEFAVILANVTGVTLPSLSEATITPILATIE